MLFTLGVWLRRRDTHEGGLFRVSTRECRLTHGSAVRLSLVKALAQLVAHERPNLLNGVIVGELAA